MSNEDHVLYVDGDREHRERVAGVFRKAGYAVTTASEGEAAAETIRSTTVDCVVSEYRLPDTDGLSLFDRLYSLVPGVTFVLYTGHGSESLAGDAVAAGVAGYVPKDDGVETLLDRVDQAILLADRRQGLVATEDEGTSTGDGDPPDPLATLGDAVYALDEDGRFTSVNGQLLTTSGYTREELIGTHVGEILAEGDLERATTEISALFSGGDVDSTTFEVTILDKDSRTIPCEVTVTVLGDEEFGGTVGLVRPIPDRKRMKARLREQKSRIDSLHGTASRLGGCETRSEVYSLTVEAAERVLDIAGCAIHVIDSSETYLVPHTWTGEDEARTYTGPFTIDDSLAGDVFRTGETRRVDDCRGSLPDLDPYRSLLVVPIPDRGVFLAVATDPGAFSEDDVELAETLVAHGANALDRIEFETELRTERDRFAALFENVPDPVVDAEFDETDSPVINAVNPAFERVFGLDADAVVGQRLDPLIVPGSSGAREHAETINARVAAGEPVEAEVRRQTVDGIRSFLLTTVPVEDEEESDRRFAVYTDITDRKQRRQRVEVLNRVLRHDLRNGMNVVATASEALAPHVDDAGQEFRSVIDEKVREMVELTEKSRALQRDLDGNSVGPLDVVQSVEEAVDAVRETHPEASITVDIPGRALADADEHVGRAIEEVVQNAVEHNDREEPWVSIAVEVDEAVTASGTSGDRITIRITDDGPGIPDAERDLVVGNREISQLRHGSGLGLWLVRWLVTGAGGTLDIEDRNPRGSTVTIGLPATEPDEETADPSSETVGDE